MQIKNYALQLGFHNVEQLRDRIGWTCGAFAIASLAGPVIFRDFKVLPHLVFGTIQGVGLNVMFHSQHVTHIHESCATFDPERPELMNKVARVIQFTLVIGFPLILAKTVTSWLCTPISLTQMMIVGGAYNSTAGIAAAYGYQYMKGKTLRES